MTNDRPKARWSLSAFVMILAALIALVAFRHVTSALVFLVSVCAVVAGLNALARAARRNRRSE